ncbi:MAG: hypothetical protein V7767_16220, partial [Leeuwenhoekiella sp.]
MKVAAKYIQKNYLILIIKLLIVSLFILSLLNGFQEITNHYYAVSDFNKARFIEYLDISVNESYLRPVVFLLIPFIGIFNNNKIGWILIQSYFYFLISNLTFSVSYIDLTDETLLFLNIFGFALLLT